MRATVSAFNLDLNNYQVITENGIGLSFSIQDGSRLRLNEVLEVELSTLLITQNLKRSTSGEKVKIIIGEHDMHDLRKVSVSHGDPRTPSTNRLSEA